MFIKLLCSASMATTARVIILCELQSKKTTIPTKESAGSASLDSIRIVLQPRVCNLRSYGSDRAGVVKTRRDVVDRGDVSSFFASLSQYIENSKKTEDFEIISGRFAMVVFASTIMVEFVTGNSLFRKMDLQEITRVIGVCLFAISCSVVFAWVSSARNRVGRIFTVKCNTFIDSLIDDLIDGLFYGSDPSDWSDDV